MKRGVLQFEHTYVDQQLEEADNFQGAARLSGSCNNETAYLTFRVFDPLS